ncbi:MAG: single-stranded-DNA-specific exonuclease RecJ [Beijerinckiaceae bacterium]|nr:single-stranded-DNA-specific exonuclease RecJ [Beijerinckiaceae bacterium]
MSRPFLGVERSVSDRVWRERLDDASRGIALALVQEYGLDDLLARVLAGRGVTTSDIPAYLEPRLRELMPDPSTMIGMDEAAERLAQAIIARDTVAIFGDYDVDGACSSAVLAGFLDFVGVKRLIHIPDRLIEGYGPNSEAIQSLHAAGAKLLVTVDCGTTSHEPIDEARRLGMDCIVLDHHQAPDDLPSAFAIVNPNRQDDLSGLGHLCAAGVVFMTLIAVTRVLRAKGFWKQRGGEPDLMAQLDLVALGTVADVVPLRGLNRAFVRQGLQVARARARPGLRSLADIARVDGPMTPFHLGFLIGPRINAGGRIGDAALGANLLLTQDEGEAAVIATRLDALNKERQEIEVAMVAEAEAEALVALGVHEDHGNVIVTASEQWHPGVVGLVAARLKERFRRPAFAIALDGRGTGTGSGRSIQGVDLGRAVRAAVEAGLAIKGGGHAMAAGVTLRADQIDALRDFLEARLGEVSSDARAENGLVVDGAISAGGVRPSVINEIDKAGPFGSAQPEPLFVLPSHQVVDAALVGSQHVRARFRSADGTGIGGIAFRAAGGPIGDALLKGRGTSLHIAGHLTIDRYGGGERPQIRIVDVAVP